MPMPSNSSRRSNLRGCLVHSVRLGILAGILGLVHLIHAHSVPTTEQRELPAAVAQRIPAIFGEGATLGPADVSGRRSVAAASGAILGYVIQTSPASDRFLGFSGPTNMLLAFDEKDRIRRIEVVSSRDTRDHVALILKDRSFFDGWLGLTASQAAARSDVKHVAGATLTSMAMTQGIRSRLGAKAVESKFSDPLTKAEAVVFFKEAEAVRQDETTSSLWHVLDVSGAECGLILRTSPSADEIVGYQGPTDARIGIAADGKIVGLVIGKSFDNEPYVGYARKDRSFAALIKKYSLKQLHDLDLEKEGIEGVSGATMTSLAVAQGLVKAAADYHRATTEKASQWARNRESMQRAAGTSAVVLMGALLGMNTFRGRRGVRVLFQIVVLGYLGFINGELLSVAMFAGWAQSGVPWQNALGLIVLTVAAVALPIFAKRNVYCSHICPHGVVQQWLPRKWKHVKPLPRWLNAGLHAIRPILIVWIVVVLCLPLAFVSLVDLEAFDAYAWRAAALPSIAVAIVGLVFSLFVPMGYCRYGCVTGSLLQYIRRHSQSDRFHRADWFAVGCLFIAVALFALT